MFKQIKDIAITKTTANDSDFLIMQNPTTGETYKITKANLLAGLSGGITAPNTVVFMSNFSSITDSKGHPITVVGDSVISAIQSKFDGASICFDGEGDYLQLAASTDWNFGTEDFTIEAWLYPINKRSSNGRDNVFISTAVFNNSGWQLEINSNTTAGNKALSFFIGQYQNRIFVDDEEWVNSWKYIAVRRTTGTLELWVDGALKKTITGYTFDATNTQPLVIGRAGLNWDATHFWKGYCGGLKISKSSLNVSTVPAQKFTVS